MFKVFGQEKVYIATQGKYQSINLEGCVVNNNYILLF